MNSKILHNLLVSNGVPIQAINWTFSELDNMVLKTKLQPMLDGIDEFLQSRKSLMLHLPTNPVLASRLGVCFLKAAIIGDYYRVKYTIPTNIVGYKIEDWDGGDAYDELLNADLLVIDKIVPLKKQDGFPQQAFDDFIEDRLMRNKSTILICGENPNIMFAERIRMILITLGILYYTEYGAYVVK